MDERLETLLAKQELTELIYAYCTACDRADTAALKALYHPDAEDDHGHFGSGPAGNFLGFVEGNNQSKGISKVMHNITNISLVVEGARAEGQSYVIAFHVIPDEQGVPYDFIYLGRYLDKFEKRDGAWKILHRRCVVDMSYRFERSAMTLEQPLVQGFHRGANGPDDESYAFFEFFYARPHDA